MKPARLAELPREMSKRNYQQRKRCNGVSKKCARDFRKYDNRMANMISAFAKVDPMTTVPHFDSKSTVNTEVQCPVVVKLYNKYNGGVDLDYILEKAKNYYLRLLFHMVDMDVVNAWLLYRRNDSSLKLETNIYFPFAAFKDMHKEEKTFFNREVKQTPKKGCNRPSVSIQKD